MPDGEVIMNDRSADFLDEAARIEQAITDKSIAFIRENAARIDTSNPSGLCYYCEEPVHNEGRFCDADCARDWDRTPHNLRRNS
jgi:hypothetical protein